MPIRTYYRFASEQSMEIADYEETVAADVYDSLLQILLSHRFNKVKQSSDFKKRKLQRPFYKKTSQFVVTVRLINKKIFLNFTCLKFVRHHH